MNIAIQTKSFLIRRLGLAVLAISLSTLGTYAPVAYGNPVQDQLNKKLKEQLKEHDKAAKASSAEHGAPAGEGEAVKKRPSRPVPLTPSAAKAESKKNLRPVPPPPQPAVAATAGEGEAKNSPEQPATKAAAAAEAPAGPSEQLKAFKAAQKAENSKQTEINGLTRDLEKARRNPKRAEEVPVLEGKLSAAEAALQTLKGERAAKAKEISLHEKSADFLANNKPQQSKAQANQERIEAARRQGMDTGEQPSENKKKLPQLVENPATRAFNTTGLTKAEQTADSLGTGQLLKDKVKEDLAPGIKGEKERLKAQQEKANVKGAKPGASVEANPIQATATAKESQAGKKTTPGKSEFSGTSSVKLTGNISPEAAEQALKQLNAAHKQGLAGSPEAQRDATLQQIDEHQKAAALAKPAPDAPNAIEEAAKAARRAKLAERQAAEKTAAASVPSREAEQAAKNKARSDEINKAAEDANAQARKAAATAQPLQPAPAATGEGEKTKARGNIVANVKNAVTRATGAVGKKLNAAISAVNPPPKMHVPEQGTLLEFHDGAQAKPVTIKGQQAAESGEGEAVKKQRPTRPVPPPPQPTVAAPAGDGEANRKKAEAELRKSDAARARTSTSVDIHNVQVANEQKPHALGENGRSVVKVVEDANSSFRERNAPLVATKNAKAAAKLPPAKPGSGAPIAIAPPTTEAALKPASAHAPTISASASGGTELQRPRASAQASRSPVKPSAMTRVKVAVENAPEGSKVKAAASSTLKVVQEKAAALKESASAKAKSLASSLKSSGTATKGGAKSPSTPRPTASTSAGRPRAPTIKIHK